MRAEHFEYNQDYRMCRHCGHKVPKGFKFNGKMLIHLRKHSSLPQPPPKVHLCPECGESFTVSCIPGSWEGGDILGLGHAATPTKSAIDFA